MCLSSSQNENESLTGYWLYISGSNNGTKNFTSLQVEVAIADNIERKVRIRSTILSLILQRPYKIPGLEPVRYNSL